MRSQSATSTAAIALAQRPRQPRLRTAPIIALQSFGIAKASAPDDRARDDLAHQRRDGGARIAVAEPASPPPAILDDHDRRAVPGERAVRLRSVGRHAIGPGLDAIDRNAGASHGVRQTISRTVSDATVSAILAAFGVPRASGFGEMQRLLQRRSSGGIGGSFGSTTASITTGPGRRQRLAQDLARSSPDRRS